jgi:hypothetical protein
VVSIQMHSALGFQPSGHIDNLPQGVRELLFYKRIPPRWGQPRWGQVLHSDISVPADPGNRRENVGM